MATTLVTGCATAAKPGYVITNPYRITAEVFHANTTTIALTRSADVVGLENIAPVLAVFDSLLETSMRQFGFTVVSADEFDEIAAGVMGEVGDVVGRQMGQPDTARIRTLWRRIREEIRTGHDVDAVLFPTLEIVPVEVEAATRAAWLGASECVRRAPIRLFGCGQDKWTATLPGLALLVTIVDMDGDVVFRNGGGIQLLATPRIGLGKAFSLYNRGGGTVNIKVVPRDELFADAAKTAAAVAFALQPLASTR